MVCISCFGAGRLCDPASRERSVFGALASRYRSGARCCAGGAAIRYRRRRFGVGSRVRRTPGRVDGCRSKIFRSSPDGRTQLWPGLWRTLSRTAATLDRYIHPLSEFGERQGQFPRPATGLSPDGLRNDFRSDGLDSHFGKISALRTGDLG